MPAPTDHNFPHTRRFLIIGLFLLAGVFLTPFTMDPHGHSFFTVARSSTWFHLGNWRASWCSLKIMLLGVGGLLITISLTESLISQNREKIARLLRVSMIIPLVLFFLGGYYLLKALL